MKNSEMFIPIVDDGSVAFTLCRSDPKDKKFFQYSEVLADLKSAKQFRAVSYNLSTNPKDKLLKEISKATEGIKDIKIVFGLPNFVRRFWGNANSKYYKEYQKQISDYVKYINQNLQNQRIRVAFNGFNHVKIIGTENVLYVGSQNLTQASCTNYESGVIIKNPAVIKKIYDEMFEELWSNSIECTMNNLNQLMTYTTICDILKDIESLIDDIYIFEIDEESFKNEEYVQLHFAYKEIKNRIMKYHEQLDSIDFLDISDTVLNTDLESVTNNMIQSLSKINDESLFDELIDQIGELQSINIHDLVDNWMLTNKGHYYAEYYNDAIHSVLNEINERVTGINALITQVQDNLWNFYQSLEDVLKKVNNGIIHYNWDELERRLESKDS